MFAYGSVVASSQTLEERDTRARRAR